MTLGQISLVAALVLATSCATGAPREAEPLVPEHAGCREQLADGTCILEETRTLVVVTPGKPYFAAWSAGDALG